MLVRRICCALLALTAAAGQEVMRMNTSEILLDLIVRDKRGRLVKDLNPADIVISDGGKQYPATSLRLMSVASPGAESEAPKSKSGKDAFRQLRLVTFLFEPLPRESARLAKETATELIARAGGTNVFFNVVFAKERLKVLQAFTTDRTALGKAIQVATLQAGSKGSDDMAKVAETNLRSLSMGPDDFDRLMRGDMPKSQMGQGNTDPTDVVRAQQATVMLNMLSLADSMQRQYAGRVSFNALRAAVRALAPLPGRKTIVYVCRGVTSHPSLTQTFRDLTEAANAAGVSIYGVDATGLEVSERTREAAQMLARAAAASMSVRNSTGGEAVTREQVMAFETAEQSAMANPSTLLAELAAATGGLVLSDSNDSRKMAQQIAEDIAGYWEVTYKPEIESFDGSFHPVSVKVQRNNVKVQARKGYFAVPPGVEGQVAPFEIPLLAALQSKGPPPGDIPFDAITTDLVPAAGGRTRGELSIELPIERFGIETEPAEGVFRVRAAILALFRDEKGEIVERLSQTVPYQGPLDRVEDAKHGMFHWHKPYTLPPGHYDLEIALQDRVGQKISTQKSKVTVRPVADHGLDLSAVRWVRPEAAPAGASEEDPLWSNGAVLNPHAVTRTALAGSTAGLPLHLVLHKGNADPPKLEAAISRDGEALAKMPVEVPAAGLQKKAIPIVITLPTRDLEPGHYEMEFTASQGTETARQVFAIDLDAAPGYVARHKPVAAVAAVAVPEEPAIRLKLSTSDSFTGKALDAEQQRELVERLKQRAKDWSGSLIDFVCLQVTDRFVDRTGKGEFAPADTIREMVTYVNGKESYDLLAGATSKSSTTSRGVRSFGEFGGMMRSVLSEQAKATLRWKGIAERDGSRMHVFEYRVPHETSMYRLTQEDPYRVFKPSYSGEIYAEEDTLHVRRITLQTSEIPEKFPFQEATHEIDYEFQRIAGVSYLLPARSVMQTRIGKRRVVRSEMQFSNYRKWSTESTIRFGQP